MDQLTIPPGERAEIIVDLSDVDQLNLLDTSFGRGLELRTDETLTAVTRPIPSTLNHIERYVRMACLSRTSNSMIILRISKEPPDT